MITIAEYREANAAGLRHKETGDQWFYYTPSLQIAYDLGRNSVSLQDVDPITTFRFGKAPENFVSWNYRDNVSEGGLSVYTEKSVIRAEFADRKRYTYEGIPVGQGSDGEVLILAFDAPNLD